MEEILQSIRKIIAEDEDKPAAAATAAEAPSSGSDVLELSDANVLELTEMVEEPSIKPAPKIESAPTAPPANDILSTIDEALSTAAPEPSPATKVKPMAEPSASPSADSLLSDEATNAATAAIKKMKAVADPEPSPPVTTPSPVFQSGNSVEQMVMDMLKPMMKSWLDKNLPVIVERIVEREVHKLKQQ